MRSLRGQLTLRLLLGGALLTGAAGAVLDWRVRAALTSEFDAALLSSAQSLFAFTEQSHGMVLMELAGETMPQFIQPGGANVYLLRDAGGREVKRSPSLGPAQVPLRSGPLSAPEYWEAVLPDGRDMRFAGIRFVPMPEDEDPKNSTPGLEAVLVVGRDWRPLAQTLATLRTTLGIIGVGTLVALVALVLWSLRAGLGPLDRLGQTAAGIDATTLTTRFPTDPLPLELRPIAARLNELLARLEQAFDREHRFTANVAHELRTPLAELRTLAEVNLATPSTPDERAESWRDALATTLRMESVALRLLELARAEDPACVVRPQSVDLAKALQEAWRPWVKRASERRVGLSAALPADRPWTCATDPALLAVILDNLIRNAAEHASPGTPLLVTATEHSGAITLHFRNRAEHLAESDLVHLFEPFWKKDAARANRQHHGLGLALAAQFAGLLGGSLGARLVDKEVEFSLRLPPG